VHSTACKQTTFKNPFKKTGGVLDQYNSSPLLVSAIPEVGDIFIKD
jgi:hypothetical protein